MKRSLILLLVLAMVAMMIPGFAMAEGEFTIDVSTTSYTHVYRPDGAYYPGISVTAQNYEGELYYVMSLPQDNGVVKFEDYGYNFSYESYSSYIDVPWFSFMGIGQTKLTITVEDYFSGSSVTKEVAIEVKQGAKTEKLELDGSYPLDYFKMTVGESSRGFSSCVKSTPDASETQYGDDYLWTISADDAKKARVTANGYVTPLAAGSVKLIATAKDNDKATVEIPLTIEAAKEEEKKAETAPTLSFTTPNFDLVMEDCEYEWYDPDDEEYRSFYLKPYLSVVGGPSTDSYRWTSSDSKIVAVDNSGRIFLKKVGGPVTITVRSKKFPEASAKCTVTVDKKEKLESISFSDVPESIELGSELALMNYLNVKPIDYSSTLTDIEFKSNNPQVAYVSGTYLDTKGIGEATITATCKTNASVKPAEFTIKVVPVPITEIIPVKSEYTLTVGKGYDFSTNRDYSFEPSNYTKGYYTVIFTSDNDDVVRTDDDDYDIKAENVGEANITITVRNADGSVKDSKPIKVTVTDKAPDTIGFKKDAYTFKLSNKKNFKSMALKLTPADAFVEDGDLYVESSDPTVATATVKGTDVTVTAYKGGETTLTVKSHTKADLTGKTKFTVDPIKLESVSLEEKIDLPYFTDAKGNIVNSDKQIKATINPSDAFFKATWETSDPSVVLVDGNEDSRYAYILPVSAGTAKVTVTMTDGTNTLTATTTVTVKAAKVTKLALSTTKATVYRIKGEDNTLQLTATDTKTDAVVPVTWASSNKKIATVSKTGLVTFKKAGKVNITATTKDGNKTKATCKLTIKQLKVTKVVPAKKTMTMKVGEKATLVVNLKPAKAFNKTLAFKSSNKKVVTVDAEGNVTAVKAGKAVITITAKDGSKKSAKVTITVKGAASNEIDEIGDVAVDAENDIELTLDSIDGIDNIDDLFIDGEVALEANDAGVVEIG